MEKELYIVTDHPSRSPFFLQMIEHLYPSLEAAKDYIYSLKPDYRDYPVVYDGLDNWEIGVYTICRLHFEDKSE